MKIEIINEDGEEQEKEQDRIMKRKEVALLFGVQAKVIDGMAREGILRKIVFKNRIRSSGFLRNEVLEVLRNR